MRKAYQIGLAISMALVLAACATGALEPQSQRRDPRLARLYFLRQSLMFGSHGVTFEVAINGQAVGAVGPGSYFFVDRPPGRYTIGTHGNLDFTFKTETQVAAGGSYYFEIAQRPPGTPMEAMSLAMNSVTIPGKPMPSQGEGYTPAGLRFYQLDPSVGAAKIAGLKPPEQ